MASKTHYTAFVHPSQIRVGDIVLPNNGKPRTVTAVARLAGTAAGEPDVLVQFDNRSTFGSPKGTPAFEVLIGEHPNPLIKKEYWLEPRHAAVKIRRPRELGQEPDELEDMGGEDAHLEMAFEDSVSGTWDGE